MPWGKQGVLLLPGDPIAQGAAPTVEPSMSTHIQKLHNVNVGAIGLGGLTKIITWTEPFADAAYAVALGVFDTSGNAITAILTAKTKDGFTVHFTGGTRKDGQVLIDAIGVRY